VKDTLFSSNLTFNSKGILYDYTKPIVMGILNATPDSFYGKSRVSSVEIAVKRGMTILAEGATILDIGGYSSRPGATDVSEIEEIRRVLPIIEAIKEASPSTLISIDTFRANVADAAIKAGAGLVNDISGGQLDPPIMRVSADNQCPYILMHMRGTPQTMISENNYTHLMADLLFYFSKQISAAKNAGLKDIILDPGFGFSKNSAQNFELLRKLERLHILELPLLVGISRKSMIYKSLHIDPSESLNGTTVLNTITLEKGAKILRVHDVKAAIEAVELVVKLKN
jgi:dihydropteroate synthase